PGAVLALLSVTAQGYFVSWTLEATERGRAGIVRIGVSPDAFGRLVSPERVRELQQGETAYLVKGWVFIIACGCVAALSLWFFVALMRSRDVERIAAVC